MATFRSNLNSVSSTYSLSSFKRRITTCFHNLCRKTAQEQQIKKPHQCYHCNYDEEFSFVEKASHNFKNLSTKLKKYLTPTSKKKKSRFKSEEQRNSEFVAKLLSSTLLAATSATITTRTTTTTSANLVHCKQTETESSEMTISEETFLQVRDEYPDLDVEVRSILIARAQNGATVAEIREDYYKITGQKFPIYENVTEFLLTIPAVTAYCNDRGTRIFNIMPTDKTKHLYDLVLNQKPQSQQYTTRPSYMNRYNNNNRDQLWRYDWENDYNHIYNNNNNNNCNINAYAMRNTVQKQIPPQSKPSTTDALHTNAAPADSAMYLDNNYFYLDNCKHLFNRLYNHEKPLHPEVGLESNNDCNNNCINNNIVKDEEFFNELNNKKSDCNNFNTNLLPLKSTENYFNNQQPEQQQQKQGNLIANNNKRPFRPYGRNCRMRASSPAATRSSRTNESLYTTDSNFDAHLLDFPLLGDDFFMYFARMELGCKFKKFQKVLQSGLCVSGQTISAATRRIWQLDDTNKRIIVNIGSVDIMQGRPLVKIEHDYRLLIDAMHRKGLTPILTTLAPLANFSHDKTVRDRLERFNEFIKRHEYLVVIDIWSCLATERKQTLFDCYQEAPRFVTGTSEAYVFWNKIGRQRVLQKIESSIEY